MSDVKITGVKDVLENLSQVAGSVFNISKSSLESVMDTVERESQAQVPHDKGTLQNSARRKTIEKTNSTEVELSYNTPYARRWEYEKANFKKGRKNKYLRDPLEVAHGKMAVTMANALNKKLI